MPDPTVDAPGAYWADLQVGATALSAADLNARELLLTQYTIPLTFSREGILATGAGTAMLPLPVNTVITGIRAAVGTAPSGQDIILDVNRNGTTIFTTQANRPRITANTNVSANTVPDAPTLVAGDRITIDIDQVGTPAAASTAGVDLTVVILAHQTATGPPSTYSDTVLGEPSLAAYWHLAEPSGTTSADAKGNHTLTLFGTPSLAQAPLIVGGDGCILFNGTTQNARCSVGTSLQFATPTLEAWVQVPSSPLSADRRVVSVADNCVVLGINNNRKPFALFYDTTTATNQQATGATTIPVNTHIHLACTFSTPTLRLYVNGVQDATATGTAINYGGAANNVAIASETGGTAPYDLNGFVDEVAIYSSPLDVSTLLLHYNKGIGS